MSPHTPFILAAYASASLIMLLIVILPILRGRRLRRELRNRARVETQRQSRKENDTHP